MRPNIPAKLIWLTGLLLPILLAAAPPPTVEAPPVEEPSADGTMDDFDLLDMKVETVVTGMRRRQDIREMPYAVSVITAEEIRRSGARNIQDALRLVPGMDMADLSYGSSTGGPRGFSSSTSTHTLILVDGRQVYDPVMVGVNWGGWPFELEDIDHIEVVRGPAGVIWGANATEGMINIVTKDPADQLGTTSITQGGSPAGGKEYLGHGFQDGKLRMRVSGEYEGSDGFQQSASKLRRLNDDYGAGRFTAHGIYEKGPRDTISFSAGSDYAQNINDIPLLITLSPEKSFAQANYLQGRWDHKVAQDNYMQMTGFVNDYRTSWGTSMASYQYQQLALQFNHTFKPAKNHTLIWGIDTREDWADTSQSGSYTENFISNSVIGIYAEDAWRFAPKWILTAGGRYDYDSYGGFNPSGRLALSYEPDARSMVYAAVSRAFLLEPPSVRFLNSPILGGLSSVRTDPDVRPLTVIAYETGYRRKWSDRLDTNVNLYWNEYRDNLGEMPKLGFPELLYINIQNVGEYSTYGVEFESKLKLTQKLYLLGNYTFQMMNWRCRDDFTVGGDSVSPPRHKFMIGPRYDVTDNLHLSSQLWYVDAVKAPNSNIPLVPMHVAPYFRLDVRAEYEFWKKQAAVAVGVRNLLDPNHYEGGSVYKIDAEVPRMVYVEFRVTFK